MKTNIFISSLVFILTKAFTCTGQSMPQLIPFKKDSLWGYCNKNKQIIIEPKYNEVALFENGYALVRKNDKSIIIDPSGNEIIPAKYERLRIEDKDIISVFQSGCKFGAIDFYGKEIIPATYDRLAYYKEHFICLKGTTYFFFDKRGKLLRSHTYDFNQYGSMSFGFDSTFLGDAVKVWKNKKVGLLNSDGDEIVPPKFDNIQDPMTNKFILVSLNGKTGVYDRSGKIIHETDLDEIRIVDANEKVPSKAIIKKENSYGLINLSNGNILVPVIYNNMGQVYSGISNTWNYAVTINGKMGLLDSIGNVLIPISYTMQENFSFQIHPDCKKESRLYCVTLGNKVGMVDAESKERISIIYESIDDFYSGYARVKRNGKFGYVDLKGNEAIPCKYEELGGGKDGLIEVRVNHMLIGYVDFNGKEYF